MHKIVGSFEKISFPDLGINEVIAKVDTGALSGALHATNIKEISLSTGEKALCFTPLGYLPVVTLTAYSHKQVKSSNGHIESRFVIETTVVLRGIQYQIHISLADRSDMMKDVLLGRKFLLQHGFVVDVSQGTEYRNDVRQGKIPREVNL